MGRYLDLIKNTSEEESSSTAVLRSLAELSPIVPFDEIRKVVDNLEARFLGIRPNPSRR
jgi:hypothetical protein